MTTAKLAGVPLLASQVVQWSLRDGVAPVTQSFQIPIALVPTFEQIADSQTEVNLEISSAEGSITIERLLVITAEAGPSPFIGQVLVGDARWKWPYTIAVKRYNIRRRAGFKRREAFDQRVLNQVTPVVQFADFSLNENAAGDKKPWRAIEMLEDLLTASDTLDLKKGEYDIDASVESLENLPVENVILTSSFDVAVQTILQRIPGAKLWIDRKGVVQVSSRLTGEEEAQILKARPEVVAGGHVERISNSTTRPTEVHVLFSRESEVRFDYEEGRVPADGERIIENVLPIPDYQLTINGETLPQNTWVTVEEAIAAWNVLATKTRRGTVFVIDKEDIRGAFIPELGMWSRMDLAGTFLTSDDEGTISARLAALRQHYRQTFRIPRDWMDRILSMKAYLVSTIDPTSGERANSIAYADHALRTSQKAMVSRAPDDPLTYAHNVNGYPTGAAGVGGVPAITDTTKPAPARVSIVDQEQGIIRVDYIVDQSYFHDLVFPSKIEGTPTLKPNAKGTPIAWNAVAFNAVTKTKLAADHKLALILTCVPAAPNNKKQMHRVIVKPGDIRALLPKSAQSGLQNAKGPIKEIYVGPAIETARIAWLDEEAEKIDRIFGIGNVIEREDLQDLVVNDDIQAQIGQKVDDVSSAASLIAIAQAEAARVYAGEADRLMGYMTGHIDPTLEPKGFLSEVAFRVETNGNAFAGLNLPAAVPPVDFAAFLDENTRSVIYKEVQQPK